jgi:hypothetical protein
MREVKLKRELLGSQGVFDQEKSLLMKCNQRAMYYLQKSNKLLFKYLFFPDFFNRKTGESLAGS